MRPFRKAIIATVSFFLIISLFSSIVIMPLMHFDPDRLLRNELAGTIDYIIIGASHGLCGFVPEIIDKKLSCNSYNLCGSLTTFNGRLALLKEEIQSEPLKTVIVEISYNTLCRPTFEAEGNAYIIPRLNSRRFTYALQNIRLNDLDTVYSYYFSNGVHQIIHFAYLTYKNIQNNDLYKVFTEDALYGNIREYKGFMARGTLSAEITKEEAIPKYNKEEIDRNYNIDNLKALKEIVDLCKVKGAEIIFVMVPVADSTIWEYNNWDDFYNDIKTLSENFSCKLYDFNLLRSRYTLFSDATSYWGGSHLCEPGAQAFTEAYCDIMQKVKKGEDVSNLFYSTYEEMKADSPYMHYLSE